MKYDIVIIGFGKAKGEAVSWISYLLFGAGIIAAGFGWWDTIFTSGFAF